MLVLLRNVKFAFVQEKRTDKNFLCDVTGQDQLESFFFNHANQCYRYWNSANSWETCKAYGGRDGNVDGKTVCHMTEVISWYLCVMKWIDWCRRSVLIASVLWLHVYAQRDKPMSVCHCNLVLARNSKFEMVSEDSKISTGLPVKLIFKRVSKDPATQAPVGTYVNSLVDLFLKWWTAHFHICRLIQNFDRSTCV